jgi:hypothetical protein
MKEFVLQYGLVTVMSAVALTILIVAIAHAASVHVGATVTFMRVEKISVQGQNFSLAMAQSSAPAYQVQQNGNEKIVVVE